MLPGMIQDTQELLQVIELRHSKVGSQIPVWFCRDTSHQYMLDPRHSFIRTAKAS